MGTFGTVCDPVTDSGLVDLIDVTLVCEDANSKLVGVVTVANVDDEDRVGNSLLQIWKLRFGRDSEDEILSRFGFELVRTLVS